MAPTPIKSAQEVALRAPNITLHAPEPGGFRLETVARAGQALRLIEQILQRGASVSREEEARQAEEKSETS